MVDAETVAKWMVDQLNRGDGVLYQDDAAATIEKRFGEKFLYVNDSGGISIGKKVLAEFRALTEKTVVWDRGERAWRKRERYDDPNSRQTD